jgi:phage tail sheath protein FI
MPEFVPPGVFVEETSFRSRSIEGVGTSTAAFLGPTRKGPASGGPRAPEPPELLTSVQDFDRIYGGPVDLELSGGSVPNYVAHAVRGFFNEGGSRLYVCRVVVPEVTEGDGGATVAGVTIPNAGGSVSFRARFAGAAGNGRITVVEVLSPATEASIAAAPPGTLLRSGGAGGAAVHHLKEAGGWTATPAPANGGGSAPVDPGTSTTGDARIVTLRVIAVDGDGSETIFDDLGFDRSHPRGLEHVLAARPGTHTEHLANAFAVEVGDGVSALELHEALFDGSDEGGGERRRTWLLSGGSDGPEPTAAAYDDALWEIGKLEDVATVAAPGSSAWGGNTPRDVMNALINHCEAPGAYRLAILDPPPGQTPEEVRALRGHLDSRYAALYYPWVVVTNPAARPGQGDIPGELTLPPSGFLCGIYARSDAVRGVHKAPANEVVRSATRFEIDVNREQQALLNPIGVNCLRLIPGRGHRVWGARLISSDPEWKYVSLRRYFNYLEASVERGTRWAVFEPNGERLWAKVRSMTGDFLLREWRTGALRGSTAKEAFFVRCDRSTMTQHDIDAGRLIGLVGVAPLKPAEFVIFRIGQKTAEAQS